jgi:hypothetical protein
VNWERSERFAEWPGCLECAHYRWNRCAAYPERIPFPIIAGEVDHMVPRPGQEGDIVFTPMDQEVFMATGQRVPAKTAATESV